MMISASKIKRLSNLRKWRSKGIVLLTVLLFSFFPSIGWSDYLIFNRDVNNIESLTWHENLTEKGGYRYMSAFDIVESYKPDDRGPFPFPLFRYDFTLGLIRKPVFFLDTSSFTLKDFYITPENCDLYDNMDTNENPLAVKVIDSLMQVRFDPISADLISQRAKFYDGFSLYLDLTF